MKEAYGVRVQGLKVQVVCGLWMQVYRGKMFWV